jgi:hypothetical protein
MTRDDAIQEALEQLGVLGEGETPTAAQLTSDSRTLNLMLKSWQNRESMPALIKKFFLFLNAETRQYDLSTTASSSAPATSSFYADTLAVAYVDGGVDLEVTTGTGATDADEIIVLPDGNAAWNEDGDVESGGGTTSLTVPDLNVEAAAGNYYYSFASRVTRPIDIIYANRCLLPQGVGEDTVLAYLSHPCTILNQRDYASLAAKDTDGASVAIYYDPQWPTAQLYVWPEPSTPGEFLEIWATFQIDDMDSASDNFSLPSRWYWAVAINLARHLVGKYGVSDAKKKWIMQESDKALMECEMHETEDYLQFMPDNRGR